ncbi:Uncharacterized protein Fot_15724 [Forsythia ovata]|uniref:Uncharacterized protein n=1 Tax=Forsythia ovata TaxID=205694 RepID=A0ABD1W9Z2_9LAMI
MVCLDGKRINTNCSDSKIKPWLLKNLVHLRTELLYFKSWKAIWGVAKGFGFHWQTTKKRLPIIVAWIKPLLAFAKLNSDGYPVECSDGGILGDHTIIESQLLTIINMVMAPINWMDYKPSTMVQGHFNISIHNTWEELDTIADIICIASPREGSWEIVR